MSIAAAKARFSSVVSSVETEHEPVTILPVAQIIPILTKRAPLFGSMLGTVTELGDIVDPTGAEWTLDEDGEDAKTDQ